MQKPRSRPLLVRGRCNLALQWLPRYGALILYRQQGPCRLWPSLAQLWGTVRSPTASLQKTASPSKDTVLSRQVEGIKWIPGTKFIVDGFRFQSTACQCYFLTHVHADHTTGNESHAHGK